MINVIAGTMLLIGCAFIMLGALATLRLPDAYSRLAGSTKAATLGIGFVLGAVALHFADIAVAIRALAGIGFFLLTSPIGAQVLARSAYRRRVPLWKGTHINELGIYHASTAHDEAAAGETPPAADPAPGTTDRPA